MALKTDAKFEGKLTYAFKSDIVSESKMAELNQNKNLKWPYWPDAVWKLCFTLDINENHN